MKKRFLSIIFAVMLICALFTGCKDKNKIKNYTVTIVYNTISENDYSAEALRIRLQGSIQKEVEAGSTIGYIGLPTTTNYRFSGWYTDTSFTYQWNTAVDIVVGDMALYAKWEQIEE